jgi:hypothetical protein
MKSNSKGGFSGLTVFVLGCVLLAGCEDIIKGPAPVLDSGEGRVVITIGSGIERTVFPRADQFSKITLSFERKDGAGTMPTVEAEIGETVVSLKPGTWEITAAAYNAADPPVLAAQAKNTLTRSADNTISGNTYFILAPAGAGPGTLRYTIIPPAGMVLDPARSRIRIEQDGEILAGLDRDGFAAGVRPISAAINGGTVSLEAGRYGADIVLDDKGSVNAAMWAEGIAILPGLITELVFAPEAGDFLDPNVLATLTDVRGVNFGKTKNNSSTTVVGSSGGTVTKRTQALSAPNGTETLYFTLTKARAQTITPGGDTAAGISIATSGTVDGHTASLTQAVLTVNTAAFADTGGSLQFTLTLGENGKTSVVYTVTVNIATLNYLHVKTWPFKRMYMVGENFDPTGLSLVGIYSDGKQQPVTGGYTVKGGFDTSTAGDRFIEIEKHGLPAREYHNIDYAIEHNDFHLIKAEGFAINVIPSSTRALVFWHGLTANYESMPNQYTVPHGRTVVLAPVKFYIPDNAVYEWKVDGAIQHGRDTEFFPYTATAPSGEHTVTVTAKVNGVEIANGATKVVCTAGAVLRPIQTESNVNAKKLYAVVAPGQFGEWGDGVTTFGAGGFGGYTALKFDHSVTKKPGGEEIQIGGNAFSGWQEPGAIWVSQDDNNNGLADDTWYELAGSHTLAPLTLRNYAVTYRKDRGYDNLGNGGDESPWKGFERITALGLTELTLVGTRLDISYAYVTLWGYADVTDNGRVSLSNAIQADGTPVDLAFIDFIKIVTALHFWENPFGERSTEAHVPKDRSMGDPDKYISQYPPIVEGKEYTYTFSNYSGYDLTVEILEGGETFELARGTASNPTVVTKTIAKHGIYIDFYGGNVKCTRSVGGIASFYND